MEPELKEPQNKIHSSKSGNNVRCNNPSHQLLLEINSDKTAVFNGVKSSTEPNPGLFRKGYQLLLKWIKMIGERPAKTNRFFSVEEQRKFELECEFRRHWPNHLINKSYISRHDY